jgi:excinuclease ABC subunit A
VEHELDVIRHADWIVDVGPAAGEHGGQVLYSGPLSGLSQVKNSATARHLFGAPPLPARSARTPRGFLELRGVTRNNLDDLTVRFPLGMFTSVTGVSGSGKSSLVSQALVELVAEALGQPLASEDEEGDELERASVARAGGQISAGMEGVRRLARVDQRAIGRTPRSNVATYTGLFDHVRKLFASTKLARARRYDAGRFSFNVAKGRCDHCEGEGFVARDRAVRRRSPAHQARERAATHAARSKSVHPGRTHHRSAPRRRRAADGAARRSG